MTADTMSTTPGHVTFPARDLLHRRGYRGGVAPTSFQEYLRDHGLTDHYVSARAWTHSVLVPVVTHLLVPVVPCDLTVNVHPRAKANPVQASHVNGWRIVREVAHSDVEAMLSPHQVVLPLAAAANLWRSYARLTLHASIPRPVATLALSLGMGEDEIVTAWHDGTLREDALRTLHALQAPTA